MRGAVETRLRNWMEKHIAAILEPLISLRRATEARSDDANMALTGLARGLAFQLAENLGRLDLKLLGPIPQTREAAKMLRRFGVRSGRHALFIPRLLKPSATRLVTLLWAVHRDIHPIPAPPPPGLTSFVADESLPTEVLETAYFQLVGKRAVRLDILERIDIELLSAMRKGANVDEVTRRISSLLGSTISDSIAIARTLGWEIGQTEEKDQPIKSWRRIPAKPNKRQKRKRQHRLAQHSDSPFASLAALIAAD
jgi:ATP-dependent RNA helicase SUPV3L1/SUV3